VLRRRGGESDEEKPERLRIRPVLARIAAGYRYDWKLLLGAGLLVFGGIGLITAFDALDPNTIDEWSGGWSVVLVLLIVAQVSVPLLGAVFYSGVVPPASSSGAPGSATGSPTWPAPSPTGR